MKALELHREIKNFCLENSNNEIVKKYSRYFKGGYNGFGLDKDMIPQKVKEFKSQSWCNIELVYKVSKLLIKEEKYELPSFSLLLLNEFTKEFNYKTFKT